MTRHALQTTILAALALVAGGVTAAPPETGQAPGQGGPAAMQRQYPTLKDPRYGVLTPVPENGDIPPIVDVMRGGTPDDWDRAAQERGYRQQLQRIRRQFFTNRSERLRQQGLERLRSYSDPAAFVPMVQVFRNEDETVQRAIFGHVAESGEGGQAALAWLAIHDQDEGTREAAMSLMSSPASPPVLWLLEQGLRSSDHQMVSNSAVLASSLNALETIPLLIAGQVSGASTATSGDLAWIAVQNQTAYVQSLQAVTGNASGAYVPVMGVLSEGFVFRVQDAVVTIYRTIVHRALVAMSSYDWGQSTAHLGYDQAAWWDWYNDQYVPYKNEQRVIDELAGDG